MYNRVSAFDRASSVADAHRPRGCRPRQVRCLQDERTGAVLSRRWRPCCKIFGKYHGEVRLEPVSDRESTRRTARGPVAGLLEVYDRRRKEVL